jgi:L-ascorbate metabolism protein UlaG (beta-lactamase superfamily)
MKLTRYFQSCLLIEEGEVKILIDPSAQEKDRLGSLGRLDAVLFTHLHSDHFDKDLAEDCIANGVMVFANQSTADQMQTAPNIVSNGQEFEVKGVKIKALELPHCLLWDGSEGPQNTGFLISEKLFHPGDGKELSGLNVEILALPITGPDISLKDAIDFAKQVNAKISLPIHYNYIGTKPEVYKTAADRVGLQTTILAVGQNAQF